MHLSTASTHGTQRLAPIDQRPIISFPRVQTNLHDQPPTAPVHLGERLQEAVETLNFKYHSNSSNNNHDKQY